MTVTSILRALWRPGSLCGEQISVRQGAYGFVVGAGMRWYWNVNIDGVLVGATVQTREEAKRLVEGSLAEARR